ncbi:hypothetical protein FRB94_000194 [Tulasnella sp. JGI-2019a]|nr:hypothetical protein FRB94_000194 [Tulasnella sp. JGI-2019a]KAG9039346.1 hypothetical protein FRB95_010634 [Tulasnella sp. JGI-2019a]
MADKSPLPTIVTTLDESDPRPETSKGSGPPSPALSSVRFQTSTSLRHNNPTSTSGHDSLQLLGPHLSHQRKPSLSTNADTEEHHGNTGIALSPSPTATTRVDEATLDEKHPNKQYLNSPVAPELKLAHIDASQDTTDPSPYAFPPSKLASLVDPKNLDLLEELGGADGLITGLGTHRTRGLSAAAIASGGGAETATSESDVSSAPMAERQRVYGRNTIPQRPSKSLLQLMWLALKDRVLILLCISAVVSLALGFYSDFGAAHQPIACADSGLLECTEPKVNWVEGVAILIAVLIVVMVGSLNDWQKEKQFQVLNNKKDDRTVKVIREGNETVINIKDIVVGDIAIIEPGEIIPVDGVFLRGHNVRCDESGATGESDTIKKIPYETAMEAKRFPLKERSSHEDCFLISGSKVSEGVGEYVVVAIGEKSFNGRLMMALTGDSEVTPLQSKLNALAELIAKLGSIAGLILFTALMIRFLIHLHTDPHRSSDTKAMEFTQILIIAVTIIVVAVPEGLPLAVTLALAFATKRMTKENLLVRVLGACEIMANASVVCTDKTGTLTQNVMTVVAGCIGIHAKFAQNLEKRQERSNVGHVEDEVEGSADGSSESSDQHISAGNERHRADFALDLASVDEAMNAPLRKLFNDAIAINSTAFEDIDSVSGRLEFVGSKTETALLRFAKDLGWTPYKERRESAKVVQAIPFSSERKAMGSVVQKDDGGYRLFLKGASEILTAKSTQHVIVQAPGSDQAYTDSIEVQTKDITPAGRENLNRTIIFYANQSLRTIAVCYRDFPQWPPAGMLANEDKEIPFEQLFDDLTLIAITAIEDPLRPGVTEAVSECAGAGVTVKMCTGDNILTARSIAAQCGIYTPGGIIMEGPVFRHLSDSERMEIVPRLQVLARSSPEDKKILVETLKTLGEIVGVTGDGTNDGPALRAANVGFSMGIAGTEVAKEASDIILMDDNFASIVSAVMWGRCVNDAVRKFLQFQVSVNITAVIITFVSAVASSEESSVLTAVQLLWINIIMDTFAALALATDPASREMLKRKPERKSAPLFNTAMRMQIAGQATYQTIIILLFHFASNHIFGYHTADHSSVQVTQWDAEVNTLVFNTFVFCQIFNSINCRRIDSGKNIFAGISKNWYFIIITLFEIAVQVLIAFFGGAAFAVHHMSGKFWGVSIALGFGSIPLGYLIRCIPEESAERFFERFHLKRKTPVLPVENPMTEEWNPAIETVRDNLKTFSNIRGGRARASSFVRKSRSARLQEAGIQLPSLLAMVPTLVMTSIGAGWQPQVGSLHDPSASDPSKSSAALYAGKIQMHPATSKDDPLYIKYVAGPPSP